MTEPLLLLGFFVTVVALTARRRFPAGLVVAVGTVVVAALWAAALPSAGV